MDHRSWQWLWTVCVVVGSILVFVAVLNRNIGLAIVAGVLAFAAVFFVSRGYRKYVKEHGEKQLSPRQRAWGIRFDIFALTYSAVVGTIAAVTGHIWLVLSRPEYRGPCVATD